MKFRLFGFAVAVGAMLFGSASCIKVDENLGGNFIPTDQTWNVFPCDPAVLEGITMERSDKLSGYSTSRFTFGAIKGEDFTSENSTSFTLVPLADSLDFGENPEILQFHFTALRDTVSTLYSYQQRIIQNVYVHSLTKALDSTVLYSGEFSNPETLNKYVNLDKIITDGIPVYNGGDSLAFDFSKEYAKSVMDGITEWQKRPSEERDSLKFYLEHVPGIYMKTSAPTEKGGRINMFQLPLLTSDGYLDANYAELKIRSKYDGRQTDTLFIFYFGPSELLADDATSYPSQYAFNATDNIAKEGFFQEWSAGPKDKLYAEGGSGYKPVVKAAEIKSIVNDLIAKEVAERGVDVDENSIVINKATIYLPYDPNTSYEDVDKFPSMFSPTVRLVSDDEQYYTYAGLTDSSIESENQGEINRSLFTYCPDVSHHVQEIVKLKRGVGEDIDPNETEEEFNKRLSKYDIWFLIMHEEVVKESSSSSSYNDYYNNLLYNSYYNNMMYDPYGYGYGYGGYGGYGYGGYGYGGYGGYGYDNYYNYYMMAAYASSSTSGSSESSSIELDKDRFYNTILNGPGAGGNDVTQKPRLKITFSAPKERK